MKQQNHCPRTLALLRSKGYLCETVEKWKRFPDSRKPACRGCGSKPMLSIRSDFLGFADILAFRHGVVLVQVTDRSNHSKRRNKILASPEAKLCMIHGAMILIQSWRKVENRWQPQDEWVTLDMFPKDLPATVEEFYDLQRKEKLPDIPGSLFKHEPIRDADIPF